MFLEDNDYRIVCTDEDLEVIIEGDREARIEAEKSAQEEVESYLRSRYDTAQAYAMKGKARNAMLVRITVCIALYYLGQRLPQFMGNEQREAMYENAHKLLRDIAGSKAVPDLPKYATATDEDTNNPMRYGSMAKQRYDY